MQWSYQLLVSPFPQHCFLMLREHNGSWLGPCLHWGANALKMRMWIFLCLCLVLKKMEKHSSLGYFLLGTLNSDVENVITRTNDCRNPLAWLTYLLKVVLVKVQKTHIQKSPETPNLSLHSDPLSPCLFSLPDPPGFLTLILEYNLWPDRKTEITVHKLLLLINDLNQIVMDKWIHAFIGSAQFTSFVTLFQHIYWICKIYLLCHFISEAKGYTWEWGHRMSSYCLQ